MAQATDQINNVKSKIDRAIERYGNTVTLTSKGSRSQDAWGHSTYTGGSSTQTLGVTDSYLIASMQLNTAGRLKDGELTLLLKGDETVDESYTITIDSTDYAVIQHEQLTAADIVLAHQLVLGRVKHGS